jgi:hypothetical protein
VDAIVAAIPGSGFKMEHLRRCAGCHDAVAIAAAALRVALPADQSVFFAAVHALAGDSASA